MSAWADNMANLRTVAHVATSPITLLEGYGSPNDGGGGNFCWDATSTAADNDGTIIRPSDVASTSPGRWKRLYSGPINVRWFGAGIGAANDQPTIQAVIALIASLGGGTGRTVYLPAGTYNLSTPLTISTEGIRIIGDGESATMLLKSGTDSTMFILQAAHFCELSNFYVGMQSGSPSTGSAILFSDYSYQVLIERVAIWSMWQGITCGGSTSTVAAEVVIRDVKMFNTLAIGMKLCFALNWSISSCIIGMVFDDAWNGPGSNHYGVWLDTDSEGCIFDSVFVLGGEHAWRFANTLNPSLRGPNDHRFYSCIADNATVSCFYISYLHRSFFTACWASTQKATSDSAIVLDSLNIWGVQWDASEIMNVLGHGIKVLAARSFSITNSIFSEWDLNGGFHSAIIVYPAASCNFIISGNTFMRDDDFGSHACLSTIRIMAGSFNKYVITNNISYENGGGGSLAAVWDLGTPAIGKVVTNNLL